MTGPVGISLDFYNSLVELDQDVPTIAQALSAMGYPCSPRIEAIWSSTGFDGQVTHDPSTGDYVTWRRSALGRLAKLCGAPNDEIADLVDSLLALDQSWTVRARADAALIADLREHRLPHCILTNWDYSLTPYLTMAGLPPDIKVITSAQLGVRKPHSEMFVAARCDMHVPPERHIHVGDDWQADVVGAIRSGAWAIWITDEKEFSGSAGPDRRVSARDTAGNGDGAGPADRRVRARLPTQILVRRVAHTGSAKIQALLRHFLAKGIDFVPTPLRLTRDVEELSYLPGRCFRPDEPRPAEYWDVCHLETLGALLRRCHDASMEFLTARGGADWFPYAEAAADAEVICHNDVGPWNIPIDGERLSLIDWEMAAPGQRIWDVAHAAWTWVPFFAPSERERMGVPAPWSLNERLERLLRGYGEHDWSRADLHAAIIERQSRTLELIELARTGEHWLLANWAAVDERLIIEDRTWVQSLPPNSY